MYWCTRWPDLPGRYRRSRDRDGPGRTLRERRQAAAQRGAVLMAARGREPCVESLLFRLEVVVRLHELRYLGRHRERSHLRVAAARRRRHQPDDKAAQVVYQASELGEKVRELGQLPQLGSGRLWRLCAARGGTSRLARARVASGVAAGGALDPGIAWRVRSLDQSGKWRQPPQGPRPPQERRAPR